jgi:HK97 gp10 family phage protein
MGFTGVRLVGFAAVDSMLSGLKPGDDLDRRVEMAARLVEADAKRLCPVDTGRLRASIHVEKPKELMRAIGTNVEYAPYVEWGTHKMRAQPYLRPALEKNRAKIRALIAGF